MAGKSAEAGTSTAQLAAGAGVNITDDQEAALFFQHKGKLERALAAKKAADKVVQDLGKVIRSDHGDHGYEAMKMAIKFGTDDNAHKEAQDAINMRIRVMRWMGMPIGAQGALFGDIDRRPADEIAFDRGKLAGMEGKSQKEAGATAGYDASHANWQDFVKGWDAGQSAIFNIKPVSADVEKSKGSRKGKPGDQPPPANDDGTTKH